MSYGRILRALIIGMVSYFLSVSAHAGIASYEFSEPAMAERFTELTTVLRCPKCQNQNLADSDSIIAKDLRSQVQLLLNDGHSDSEITDFMVQRYGDFILYDPPFKRDTFILWAAPVILIFIGIFIVWLFGRKRQVTGAMLTADEKQQLQQLLQDHQDVERAATKPHKDAP